MAELPDGTHRWRCNACGNLTRFDVRRTTSTLEYWHADLGGEPVVEERTVLSEDIESVTCRWCGSADVLVVERA